MVPYHVYAEAVRDRDFMRGQISELRYLVNGLISARGRGETLRGSETVRRVRALKEIAMRRMYEISLTSKGQMDPEQVARLMRWILSELHAVRRGWG